MSKILVIIPTYNEKAVLPELIKSLAETGLVFDILFVDDNSPDGTADLIVSLQKDNSSIFLLKRAGKQGLGTAYLAGFAWGLARGYEFLIQMDADLSHNPKYLPAIIEALGESGLVIGSRYTVGGGVENWPWFRKFISRGGSFYARNILGLRERDLTGGFNGWQAETLKKIGLENIKSNGYSFQIEMKYRAKERGVLIKEVPIIFEERRLGQSKMSKKIFAEAMWRVWLLGFYSDKAKHVRRFTKFGIVGLLGFTIDFGLLLILVEAFHLNIYLANSISFFVAMCSNFYINRRWTFRSTNNTKVKQQFASFLLVSIGGLLIGYLLLFLLVDLAHIWYVYVKLIITVVVAFWNYSANHFWTFNTKHVIRNM